MTPGPILGGTIVPRARHPGPHSRLLRRGAVDGRSREGRFLAAARAQLFRHLGGNPTIAQRILVERLAWLQLHVVLFDERIANGGQFTDCDRREYLAFSNSVLRGMREIGLEPTAAAAPSLAETMAAAERKRQAAA